MPEAKINIDLDNKCYQCGAKGTTQNGLCLNCITKRIVKGGIMPEIKVNINNIDKLEVKAKVVDEILKGEVVDRKVITTVKFEYEGTPLLMNQVLLAVATSHEVTARFESPQSIMSLEEDKEPALANS